MTSKWTWVLIVACLCGTETQQEFGIRLDGGLQWAHFQLASPEHRGDERECQKSLTLPLGSRQIDE